MSTLLKIIVYNDTMYQAGFFFFQQPAIYAGGQIVYSNSLYNRALPPAGSGSSLTFQTNVQFYAAVQEADTSTPSVGQSSGFETASQAIDLAAAGNSPQNHDSTSMTWDQNSAALGLTVPANNPLVQPGAFRITTAQYNPAINPFNAGSAVSVNSNVVLSNFVVAPPLMNIDCQPVLKYYVQTGSYQPGTVMNFSESSVGSASCDFTRGHTQAVVHYKNDGTWDVKMS
jgi:hypothetical protein